MPEVKSTNTRRPLYIGEDREFDFNKISIQESLWEDIADYPRDIIQLKRDKLRAAKMSKEISNYKHDPIILEKYMKEYKKIKKDIEQREYYKEYIEKYIVDALQNIAKLRSYLREGLESKNMTIETIETIERSIVDENENIIKYSDARKEAIKHIIVLRQQLQDCDKKIKIIKLKIVKENKSPDEI